MAKDKRAARFRMELGQERAARDEDVRFCCAASKDADESLLVRVPALQAERGAVSDSSAVVTGRSWKMRCGAESIA